MHLTVIASPPFPVDLVCLKSGAKRIVLLPGHWPVALTCEEAEEHVRRVLELVREIRRDEGHTDSGRVES